MANTVLNGISDAGNLHIRTVRALVAALACAAIGNAVAADWEVWSTTIDGMTGAQQITNALTKLAKDDTIRVNPGTYDFTGIAMSTYDYSKTSSGVTYTGTITNHLARNCNYSLVGVTDGHWNDAVVFKGDARCLDAHWDNGMSSCKVTIRNITFDGFYGGACPSGSSYESRGGALRLSWDDIASNCVFRNCRSYVGGAVSDGELVDCLLITNSAPGSGGATCGSRLRDCRVANNTANGYAAFWRHTGLYNTLFENNTCIYSGGAGCHAAAYPITNCVFRNNQTTADARWGVHGGGALRLEGSATSILGEIVDCRFEGNKTPNTYGGAIYQASGDTIYPARIRRCEFTGNVSKTGGGAIYIGAGAMGTGTASPLVMDCSFSNSVCLTGNGGAVYNGSYSNCVFTANVCSNGSGGAALLTRSYGGAAMDCAFVGNVSWNGDGGAVYCSDDACPFTGCAFTNNYAYHNGGALYRGACTNCTFVGNRNTQRYKGASLYGTRDTSKPYFLTSSAVNCLFKENFRRDNTGRDTERRPGYPGGDVCCARMENCEVIDGPGEFNYCSIVNSRFHHMTNSLGLSVFNEENWVTNCLIDHCNMSNRQFAMFFRGNYDPDSGRGRERGTWVNCTFADNILESWRGMIHVQASWFTSSGRDPHAAFDFINCIFYNNRKTSETGTLADISGRDAFDVTYSNCVYGAADGTLKYGSTNGWTNVGGTFVCANPRFAKEQAAKLECTYYTPRVSSPVIGKGDASFYTDTDVDLAGKLRLKEGKVDLGAYQSWVKIPGFAVIYR